MISAVVLTKNEENNIAECLKSLRFCDEIVVVDDESDDNTVKIARRMGAVVYTHPLNNDFAAQHNYGLQKATKQWILSVDADERVSRDLAIEITQLVNDIILPYSGFTVKRTDEIWEKRILHGECGTIRLLRLVKKGSGEWRRAVHETYESKEKTYELKNPLSTIRIKHFMNLLQMSIACRQFMQWQIRRKKSVQVFSK
jgi:glycosyltransferase involved in cell wall biosynthesis